MSKLVTCSRNSKDFSDEARAELEPPHILRVAVDGRADHLSRVVGGEALIFPIAIACILVLGLLPGTLQVGSELGLERVKSATLACLGALAARRVQARASRALISCGVRATVVNPLRVDGDVAEAEVEPARAWLLEVNSQMLQRASLESRVEL